MTATLDRPKMFTCHRCRVTKPIRDEGLVVGYAKDDKDNFLCYECCGEIDRDYMLDQGKIMLYLTCEPAWKERSLEGRKQAGIVSNWPGTLKFTCRTLVGDHNIARYRYDCWFTGPDGYIWHGIQYGDNTQICHCKRTKGRKEVGQYVRSNSFKLPPRTAMEGQARAWPYPDDWQGFYAVVAIPIGMEIVPWDRTRDRKINSVNFDTFN